MFGIIESVISSGGSFIWLVLDPGWKVVYEFCLIIVIFLSAWHDLWFIDWEFGWLVRVPFIEMLGAV